MPAYVNLTHNSIIMIISTGLGNDKFCKNKLNDLFNIYK